MGQQQEYLIHNVKDMIILAWRQNRFFIVYQFVSNTIRGPFPLIVAFIQKIIIDKVIQSNPSVNNSFALITGLVVLSLLVHIIYEFLMTLDTKLSIISTNNIFVKIQDLIVEKLRTLDKKHFDLPYSKDIIYRGCNFNSDSINGIIDSTSVLLRQSFTAIVSFIVLLQYNSILAFVSIFLYFPQFFIDNLAIKDSKKLEIQITELTRKKEYYASVLESKSFIKELKVYQSYDIFINKYKTVSKEIYSLKKKYIFKDYIHNFLLVTVQILLKVSIYGYLIYMAYNSQITIGDITFLYTAFDDLGSQLSSSISMIINLHKNIVSYDYFSKFLKLKNSIIKDDHTQFMIKKTNSHKIEFKHVFFSYPESKNYVLKDINFIVESGEVSALVGANGSGKTSIIKLLLRLYDCDSGEILLDGTNIKNIPATEYYNLWGVLLQDYNIYPLTIWENIAFGQNDLVKWKEPMEKAATLSDISDTILKLPKKYDTMLTKIFDTNGYEPSGGQRQKFALGKVFLQKYDMYILDEPSSALDAKSEEKLFHSVQEELKNKTTFLISHRLSNIIHCDKIIFIKNGTIQSIGTHEDVLKNQEYAEMYKLQLSKYSQKEE